MEIQLEKREIWNAAQIGMSRQLNSRLRGSQQKYNLKKGSYDYDIMGAVGECVYAKFFNIYYVGGSPGPVDMTYNGLTIEVRTVDEDSKSLIIYEHEDPNSIFALAIDKTPNVILAGWIKGVHGKLEKYWKEDARYPAYFVPQSVLNNILELRGRVFTDPTPTIDKKIDYDN